MNKTQKIIKFMVRSAIFGAISTLLYVLPFTRFSLPFFPSFLHIHLDEIPAFIAGFAFGPYVAIAVLFIKTLIGLPFTTSLCVGEAIDLVYSLCFVVPAVFFYKKFNKIWGLVVGITIGTILQLTSSFFLNIFVMFPFYSFVFDMPMEQIQNICYELNSNVKDATWSIGYYIVLPFNALKDLMVIVPTLIISIPLNVIFKKYK